jgi:hypothetical protein
MAIIIKLQLSNMYMYKHLNGKNVYHYDYERCTLPLRLVPYLGRVSNS